MPYTSLLGLSLPTTGSLAGTWGDEVNNAITSLLDSAVAGTTTLSADADVTLTTTNGAANQARSAVIRWTAGGTVTRNITAPAQSKAYIVINATSSSQSIVIRGAGPTTGVTVPAGTKALVAWSGTDFVQISGAPVSLTADVTGTLPIANGGTGTTSTTFANLTTNVTGTLPVANGGTGAATLTGLAKGNGTSAFTAAVAGTDYVAPGGALGTPSSGTLTNATGLPIVAGTTGTLATNRGGTNLTAFTANGVVYASSTSALATASGLSYDGTDFSVLGASKYKTAGGASEISNGNAGASKTITWADGNKQSVTLDQNTTLVFSFTGCPVGSYQLKMVQDATGGRTITWSTNTPGSTKWVGSVGAPSLNPTASSITFGVFYWDGTNAYGSIGRVNSV